MNEPLTIRFVCELHNISKISDKRCGTLHVRSHTLIRLMTHKQSFQFVEVISIVKEINRNKTVKETQKQTARNYSFEKINNETTTSNDTVTTFPGVPCPSRCHVVLVAAGTCGH